MLKNRKYMLYFCILLILILIIFLLQYKNVFLMENVKTQSIDKGVEAKVALQNDMLVKEDSELALTVDTNDIPETVIEILQTHFPDMKDVTLEFMSLYPQIKLDILERGIDAEDPIDIYSYNLFKFSMSGIKKMIRFTGKDLLEPEDLTDESEFDFTPYPADMIHDMTEEEIDSLVLSESLISSKEIPFDKLTFSPVINHSFMEKNNYTFKGVIYPFFYTEGFSEVMKSITFVYENNGNYIHITQEGLKPGDVRMLIDHGNISYLKEGYVADYFPCASPSGRKSQVFNFSRNDMTFELHSMQHDREDMIDIANDIIEQLMIQDFN